MRAADSFRQIFLYTKPCDMRKQITGLSAMVSEQKGQEVFSAEKLFVFCNRRGKILKCLYWDHSGFAMWVKQLEEEKFPWPRTPKEGAIPVTPKEFQWLLSGIDLWKIKKHKKLDYTRLY